MSVIQRLLAEAVEPCITCPGTGWITTGRGGRLWCVDCKGTGHMLSEDGHALIEFLAKRLAVKFAAEDHTHSIH
jgi:hypothetical protein